MLGKTIIGYRYNYHNLQDNKPNNFNNNINIIKHNISRKIKICNETQDFYVEKPHKL